MPEKKKKSYNGNQSIVPMSIVKTQTVLQNETTVALHAHVHIFDSRAEVETKKTFFDTSSAPHRPG